MKSRKCFYRCAAWVKGNKQNNCKHSFILLLKQLAFTLSIMLWIMIFLLLTQHWIYTIWSKVLGKGKEFVLGPLLPVKGNLTFGTTVRTDFLQDNNNCTSYWFPSGVSRLLSLHAGLLGQDLALEQLPYWIRRAPGSQGINKTENGTRWVGELHTQSLQDIGASLFEGTAMFGGGKCRAHAQLSAKWIYTFQLHLSIKYFCGETSWKGSSGAFGLSQMDPFKRKKAFVSRKACLIMFPKEHPNNFSSQIMMPKWHDINLVKFLLFRSPSPVFEQWLLCASDPATACLLVWGFFREAAELFISHTRVKGVKQTSDTICSLVRLREQNLMSRAIRNLHFCFCSKLWWTESESRLKKEKTQMTLAWKSSLRHHCCTIKGFPVPNCGFSLLQPWAKLGWQQKESRCHLMTASQRYGGWWGEAARRCQRDQNHLIIFLTPFHTLCHVTSQHGRIPQCVGPTACEVNSISMTLVFWGEFFVHVSDIWGFGLKWSQKVFALCAVFFLLPV